MNFSEESLKIEFKVYLDSISGLSYLSHYCDLNATETKFGLTSVEVNQCHLILNLSCNVQCHSECIPEP